MRSNAASATPHAGRETEASRAAAQAPAASAAKLGAALTLDDLSHVYADGTRAVDGVSLDVDAGQFLTLLGPSGSGKTTTLMMIAGFMRPNGGRILLGGGPITDAPPHARNIGMVFQNYALFPHMTVEQNIAFPLKMRGWDRAATAAAVADALAMVRLDSYGARYPAQLSGGQQQRVALARALVFRPPLLLMDEPLGALDRQLRKGVQQELKRIQRSLGITVVFVTHDQDEALFLSDRIAVMNRGRVIEAGEPESLYLNPGSRFVAEFLGESNFLSGVVSGERGGLIEVRRDDGSTIVGRPAGALRAGARADALVRPEKIEILAGDSIVAPGANALTATVEMVNFVGGAHEYEMAIGGQRLRATQTLRAGRGAPAIGDSVTLSFSPDDARVFAANGAP